MKEAYYKRPVLYDYLLSVIIIVVFAVLDCTGTVKLPTATKSADFASDIGAIGLTVSGFILTLITILITLKSGQLISNETLTNSSSPFKIFLASPLFGRAIAILKYGVLSLVLVSFALIILKLVLSDAVIEYIFYVDILGLVMILATFLRCFYVLGLITKMQGG
jgi:hypothetical protein